MLIDSFAGGGGASLGIRMATGRCPDIAINHNPVALSMHAANHPDTLHIVENVWKVDIQTLTKKQKVRLLWASPDCRHFSKARGGKPTSPSVRGLAWSIVRFIHDLGPNKPDVICLENVEEFLTWEDFAAWEKEIARRGYVISHRQLRACDFGAPTIRKRLFIIMRCDGKPIVWPSPTHGDRTNPLVVSGDLEPYRSAAEIIDWSIPCPSIFDTTEDIWRKYGMRAIRPLKENTLKRIASGVMRYVIAEKNPYFVTYGQQGGANRSMEDPLHTITASSKDTNAIVLPRLTPVTDLSDDVKNYRRHLIAGLIAQHNSARGDGVNPGRAVSSPLSTITTRGTQQQLVSAHLINIKGGGRSSRSAEDPLQTVCAGGSHAGIIAAFLTKYYGTMQDPCLRNPLHTVTTKDRFSLVTVNIDGDDWALTDIGMRMLTPRELFRAQGFPDDYVIDEGADGKPISRSEQINKCGNSVCPPVVAAILRANI